VGRIRSCPACNINIAAILFYSPEQAASSLRERFSAGNGRVDVLELAKALGCRVSRTRISGTGTVEADLCPDIGRDLFYLRVDPKPAAGWEGVAPSAQETIARHRLRFRVGHELGHTFYYERQKGEGPRRAQRWSSGEEEWCDEFARSLLVPASVAETLPATADSVFRLQRRFDVSLEVAARSLARSHTQAKVALWFWPADAADPQESLLRQWVSCEAPALRRWRQSALISRALAEGGSEGPLERLSATARCGRRRRQVVLVAG